MGGELLAWQNAIFTVAFGIAAVYMVVTSLVGVASGGDHDVEHDTDVDHDLDVDHDVEVSHDVDHHLDHDATHDHDGHGGGNGGGAIYAVLDLLGARHTSVTLLLETWLLFFGVGGWCYNAILGRWLPVGAAFAGSLVLSSLTSTLLTRASARILGFIVPKESSSALGRRDLTGKAGQAVFSITATGGAARLYDQYGTMHHVACRSDGETIPAGSEVVLIDYEENGDYYLVEAVPVDEDHSDPTRAAASVSVRR